jgi:chromosome segregation ATPase
MTDTMARLGSRVLRRLGLERGGRAADLHEALRKSEQRIVELKKLLEKSRAESEQWRAKLLASSAHEQAARKSDDEKYRARVEKLEARLAEQVAKLQERDAARAEKVGELRDKVATADRSVRAGRDHLMSIEVKLDLIEGAINVLDRRFRGLRSSPGGDSR